MKCEIRNKTNRLVGMATLTPEGLLKNWMFGQKTSDKDRDSWFSFVGEVRRGQDPNPSKHGLKLVFSTNIGIEMAAAAVLSPTTFQQVKQ